MDPRHLALEVIFLLQTVFGVLGNLSLLSHQLFLYFTGCRLRDTDLIIKNLIVANILILISSGICYPVTFLGESSILNDFGCKFCHYGRQVGRGVSISTTCLLSVVQAVTISPRGSRWAGLRGWVLPCVVLCWVLNMVKTAIYPLFMSSSLSTTNASNRKMFGQCHSVRHDEISELLYAALHLFPDLCSVGLMVWASSSMVYTLYQHRQRVRHLHRSSVSSSSSPEFRATRTILLLVSTFVCFYTLSSTCQVCLSLLHNPDMFLVRTSSIIATCFPTLSPFVLMRWNLGVPSLCSGCKRNPEPLPQRRERSCAGQKCECDHGHCLSES